MNTNNSWYRALCGISISVASFNAVLADEVQAFPQVKIIEFQPGDETGTVFTPRTSTPELAENRWENVAPELIKRSNFSILPISYTVAEMERFQPTISWNARRGIWESDGLTVRPQSDTSEETVQVLEAILHEAQWTASHWGGGKTFQNAQITVILLGPEYYDFNDSGFSYSWGDDDVPLLYINSAQMDELSMVRRAMFHALIQTSPECECFPFWLQNGLETIFAQESVPEMYPGETVNLRGVTAMDADQWAEIPREDYPMLQAKCANAVRYFLEANDGRTFFPFLNYMRDCHESYLNRTGEPSLAKFDAFLREPGFIPPEKWNPNEVSNVMEVRWRTEVPDITAGESTAKNVALDDGMKSVLQEMSVVLKIAEQYRAANKGLDKKESRQAVKIREFGENPENSTPSPTTEASAVTVDEAQRITSIYAWFQNPRACRTVVGPSGEILVPALQPNEARSLFFPDDRRYLIQEYEGNLVLSATFDTGETLHAIQKSENGKTYVEFLGYESAEVENEVRE